MKNLIKHFKTSLGILGASFLIMSCDADVEIDRSFEEILSAQPEITSFSPSSATVLEEVTIEGANLNFVTKAYIGNVEAQINQRVNRTQLRILVPPQASSGKIRLVTQAEMEAISDTDITVNYLTPVVNSEIPSESIVNENVILEGENMNAITRVTFGDSEGIIEYKDAGSLVVKTPNDPQSPLGLNIWYYTPNGETAAILKEAYSIIIPKPEVNVWPRLISKFQDVSITGENMNLVERIEVGGVETPILAASANTLSFAVPEGLSTGYHDLTLTYSGSETVTEESIPFINGQLETFYDWDTYTEDAVDLDLGKDPLAMHKVNAEVEQPPLPQGSGYYHLEMGTATGSTIGRMKIHETTNNPAWQQILDAGNFSDNPVLHMWVHTEDTEPVLKIYIGGTGNPNRRELTGSNMNTGNEWKLIAVRLNGFIPDLTSTGSVMELRFNTGSSASNLPIKLNLDWIIVTDKVLTEFGAVDVTDKFKSAG